MQQLIVIGNLGSDPEMRYTPSGVAVANFNVAVTEKWKDANGQQQEKTTWYTVTAWRKLAEIVSEYLTKGSKVMIIGKMNDPRPWIDGNNNNELRCRLEMTAQNLEMLGGGTRQDGGNGGNRHRQGQAAGRQNGPSDNDAPLDEDIPF